MNVHNAHDFGALIRRSRRKTGLTQEGLAERAGVSSRTVSDLERGVARAPRRDTLELLAEALELSAEERDFWERERQRLTTRLDHADGEDERTTVSNPRTSLPISLTRLIGRESEIREILALLKRSDTRLVTLTGPGGVGKTRLALAVAERALANYPAGTAFVNLAPIEDPTLLLPRIASALGLRDESGQPAIETLTTFLSGQRMVLVLDNFEHIVDTASSISDLLVSCPDLTVLATSRSPLHIQGEQLYPIAPLNTLRDSSPVDIEQVRGSEAVALFLDRARAVKPQFDLTEDNATAVLEICRRLDGLPLAIELAAARISVLSPQLLLRRIEQRLPLLTGGPRDTPAHQRTLRTTIAWSYDLLTGGQQKLFQRLSVFRNGWTFEAATEVAGRGEDDLEIVDALSALVGHSLIIQHENPGGEVRFEMLGTIREFSGEKLHESAEEFDARQRHARYFSRLVEETEAHIDSPDQIACFDHFEREHDNLRAALDWLREQGDIETAMNMAGVLGRFWITRGHVSEGWERVSALLQTAGDKPQTIGHAKALIVATLMNCFQGNAQDVVASAEKALAFLEKIADHKNLPFAYIVLGMASVNRHDVDGATIAFNEASSRARETGDFANLARALNNLGVTPQGRGDDEEATTLFEESVAAARKSGASDILALALSNLAREKLRQGDLAQAARMLDEPLTLCCESGNQWGIAANLESLAEVALLQDDAVRATRLTAAAATLRERIGVPVQQVSRDDYERMLAGLRNALGEHFADVWAAGESLTIDEAVAEAHAIAPPP